MTTYSNTQALVTPEAILFDMDDTLVDATASYRTATVLTAKHFGVSVSLEDVSAAKAAGDANDDWILTWRLISPTKPDVTLNQVTDIFEHLYHGDDHQTGLKEAEKLLIEESQIASLLGRFKLGIVTGRPRQDAMYLLNQHNLAQYFGCVITFDDGPLKPDPHPVRLALKALRVQAAWMIGDTPDDIRAAVSAGVTPIGVIAPSDDQLTATNALRDAGAVRVLKRIESLFELLADL